MPHEVDNPLKYIDPDGRKIVISGNRQQRLEVLKYMQRLTNDKLGVKRDGSVIIISTQCKNMDRSLNTGTSLISSMVSNEKHTATISLGEKNICHDRYPRDASNGKGTDVSIGFNPSDKVSVLADDAKTGKSVMEKISPQIKLGHEMIHGYRSMNGEASDGDIKIPYEYKDLKGDIYRVDEKIEELETVGISGKYYYTENMLRKEQGYNIRIQY